MELSSFLTLAHIVAAIFGVGGATAAEVLMIRALKDGHIDPSEGVLMKEVYTMIRIGFALAFISGIGFLVLFKVNGDIDHLWEVLLWGKFTIVGVIGLNAILLQAHSISLKWGSAISFVSWYFVLFLSVVRPEAGYLTIIFTFIIALLLGKFLLSGIHRLSGIHI